MAPLPIPTLRTARLRLEPLSLSHSAGMYALWSSEQVCRHSGPAVDADGVAIPLPVATTVDSDRIIDFFVRRAVAGRGFRWAVIRRADDRFMGAVGFNHLGARPEMAYHLHPDAWGQGLMTEAARVALDWLARDGEVLEVEAFIEPANIASIALARRLTFAPTGEISDGVARYVASLRAATGTV